MNKRRYVLITAARNEERFIGETLASVGAQTLRPMCWVVVSDGSTDRTDEIVRGYAKRFKFIKLLRLDGNRARDFAAKVRALSAAYEQLKGFDFGYVGNLDADITLDSDYFERLVSRFENDPLLGIGGGAIYENLNGRFAPRPTNSVRSVAHAVHFLRRECYEDIGGYIPLSYGGEDWAANLTARMKSWRVQTFLELPAYHHRRTGTAGSLIRHWFRAGLMDCSFGSHPAFELAKCSRRMWRHPIGATTRLIGFAWASLSGKPRLIPREIVHYLRTEQKSRLRVLLLGPFLRRDRLTARFPQGSATVNPGSAGSVGPPARTGGRRGA